MSGERTPCTLMGMPLRQSYWVCALDKRMKYDGSRSMLSTFISFGHLYGPFYDSV